MYTPNSENEKNLWCHGVKTLLGWVVPLAPLCQEGKKRWEVLKVVLCASATDRRFFVPTKCLWSIWMTW